MTRIKKYTLNGILGNMKALFMLSIFLFLLNACSQSNKSSVQEKQISYSQPKSNFDTTSELTPEQESALDALNTLQVSTDEMKRLYSTFAGIVQPCYPPDTSMTISQSELLTAMKQFVTKNCQGLSVEERNELAATSVLAQEAYNVLLCLGYAPNVTFESGAPMTGTWIIPNVLGQRDVVIVW
ncbi:MAG: hypothetical protein DWQ02_08055 [Bacteroidetes bacterium]|nr:MAG: hypothetical protein DWQ02_08055 [Bacteroidota bacterium]